MAKPRQICSIPGCPCLAVKGGRCNQHQREAWSGRTWSSHPWSTPTLKRLRAQVLREEPTCRQCGRVATAVDHIIPRAWGGSDARNNLQALCRECHAAKTQREAAEGRRRQAADQG